MMQSSFSLGDAIVAASIRPQRLQPPVASRAELPQTPIVLAATKLASRAAAIVPRAFARLAGLLSKSEAPAAPLRTLLPFLTRIDPANTRALPEQIAAYVENVVDGGESKVIALLDAYRSDDATHVVAGRAAVEGDLKTALLKLTRTTTHASPARDVALRQALVAVTAAQISALSASDEDPNAIRFELPVFYRTGGRAVQMRVDRNAPRRGERADAGNFRVAFEIDTAALGALSIELESAERNLSVRVTAQRDGHVCSMTQALPALTTRLEALGYRAAAAVARAQAVSATSTVASSPVSGAGLDLRA